MNVLTKKFMIFKGHDESTSLSSKKEVIKFKEKNSPL